MMTHWLLVAGGLVALVVGAELLVRGASRLAQAVGISPLVVGLTVVAFGTSAPELAVSVSSVLNGQSDLAVGNVVGSNIFNVLLILGLSSLIQPLTVDQKLIRRDVPLMIGVSGIAWWMASDAVVGRFEGVGLLIGLLIFTVWCVVSGRQESAAVQAEYAAEFTTADIPTGDASGTGGKSRGVFVLKQIGLIAVGLLLLVLGADWLVRGATEIARWMGISELIIGLTIVAGGTSLPEVATSIVAAARGERDIAVGNVVGSNLFNLLGVLGAAAAVSGTGVAVSPSAIAFDIPVMFAVALLCLPIFFTGQIMARKEGILFLAFYVAYVAMLTMQSTGSSALPWFQNAMVWCVIPLTGIAVSLSVLRDLRRKPEAVASVGRDGRS